MASERLVHARLVMRAQMQLKNRGIAAALRELEQVEPDLAEFVMESLAQLYLRLANLTGSELRTRRLFEEVQALVLVSIDSLRKSHLDPWEKEMGQRLSQLDPNSDPPAPPAPDSTDSTDSQAGA